MIHPEPPHRLSHKNVKTPKGLGRQGRQLRTAGISHLFPSMNPDDNTMRRRENGKVRSRDSNNAVTEVSVRAGSRAAAAQIVIRRWVVRRSDLSRKNRDLLTLQARKSTCAEEITFTLLILCHSTYYFTAYGRTSPAVRATWHGTLTEAILPIAFIGTHLLVAFLVLEKSRVRCA